MFIVLIGGGYDLWQNLARSDAPDGICNTVRPDCLVLEIARKAGHILLGTFDKRLGKLPGAASV
jgi:hypothetical protein